MTAVPVVHTRKFRKRVADVQKIVNNLLIVKNDSDIERVIGQLTDRGEEFCHSFRFSRAMLNRWCYHGFLPMSMILLDIPLFSLKLHEARVLLPPRDVRTKKSLLRKFADYRISLDGAFDECLDAIDRYHPESWLTGPLKDLFRKARAKGKVRLRSVELRQGGRLVAGEIGYTVGACYTSLTGFHTESSSGTVQLYALGRLLEKSGYEVWDLGMYMPYKTAIGGKPYARNAFLQILASVRDRRRRFPAGSFLIGELT